MQLFNQLLREYKLAQSATSKENTPKDRLNYVSGEDSARHYSENQERWKAFSEDVMNALIENIDQDTGQFSIYEPSWLNGPQGNSDFEHIFRQVPIFFFYY